jgi:hypothetical protein
VTYPAGSPRFPLEPLADVIVDADTRTDRGLALRLGLDTHTVQEARVKGLHWSIADRAAIAVGQHPAAIWPDWIHAVDDPPHTGRRCTLCLDCRDKQYARRIRARERCGA